MCRGGNFRSVIREWDVSYGLRTLRAPQVWSRPSIRKSEPKKSAQVSSPGRSSIFSLKGNLPGDSGFEVACRNFFFVFTHGTGCNAHGWCAYAPPGRRRKYGAFTFPVERQALSALVPIDDQHVTETHLLGRQQVRQGIHHVLLDRSLQVPRPVLEVRPFLQ